MVRIRLVCDTPERIELLGIDWTPMFGVVVQAEHVDGHRQADWYVHVVDFRRKHASTVYGAL